MFPHALPTQNCINYLTPCMFEFELKINWYSPFQHVHTRCVTIHKLHSYKIMHIKSNVISYHCGQ